MFFAGKEEVYEATDSGLLNDVIRGYCLLAMQKEGIEESVIINVLYHLYPIMDSIDAREADAEYQKWNKISNK